MGLLFQQQYVFLQGSRPNLSVTRAEVGSFPLAGCHLGSASKKTSRWSAGHSAASFLTQVWKFRMVRVAFRANASATCFHSWCTADWVVLDAVSMTKNVTAVHLLRFCCYLGEGSIYSHNRYPVVLMLLLGQVTLSQVTLCYVRCIKLISLLFMAPGGLCLSTWSRISVVTLKNSSLLSG